LFKRGTDGAAGSQRLGLDDVFDLDAMERAAEVLLDDLVQVADREQRARAAVTAQMAEQNLKKRPAGNERHRLGDVVEARGQARAKASGKNNRFHIFSSDPFGCCDGGSGEFFSEVNMLNQKAVEMLKGEVRLLNIHGDWRRNADEVVAVGGHLSASLARETHGYDAHGAGFSSASSMLGELPEVEMARKTSPACPRASIWRSKQCS